MIVNAQLISNNEETVISMAQKLLYVILIQHRNSTKIRRDH